MKRALLASRNKAFAEPIFELLSAEYRCDMARDLSTCVGSLEKQRYDLLLIDLELIDRPGDVARLSALKPWRDLSATTPIFVLCSPGREIEASSIGAGRAHYLTYPSTPEQLKETVAQILRALEIEAELAQCREDLLPADSFDLVAFASSAMKLALERAKAVSAMDSTVLLTGETGTGKGVLAKMIHCWSPRRERPFTSVQCSAIPETLLESELFGHEKGAFTDAVRTKAGQFETARGGTLFLDEIGTISRATQVKLLQVLQEKSFHRVGGEEIIKANVRIVAATNSDLKRLIAEGDFRSDLYYRLNVFPIELPALRDRKEDIPALAYVFLKRLNRNYPKNILSIDPKAMEVIQQYPWPGNIRELENSIERAYILEKSSILRLENFSFEAVETPAESVPEQLLNVSQPLHHVRQQCVDHVEKNYLLKLLAKHEGRISRSAAAAGIGVRQLHKLLAKHRIRKEDFRSSSKRHPKFRSGTE